MVHRRIVNPALAGLSGDRAGYFAALVDRVERDPRTGDSANLVYLVLKETIPYLSTNFPEADLIEQLFAFVDDNRARLNKILFDPAYLENPALFAEATKDFVKLVLSSAMEQHEIEEIEKAKIRAANTYRFTWPDYESDKAFPYKDEDG